MNSLIPIFPLSLVIFPGSKYPLHIFEERYKILVRKCLMENSGFGIVAMIDKNMTDIGVYVKVENVIKSYDNGEFDIIVHGIKRFKIKSTSLHQDGYYIAETENYYDDNDLINPQLVTDLQNEFEEIIELANYKLEKAFWNNLKVSNIKSFKFAEKSGLSRLQQQELLILRNENDRLKYLIEYFLSIKEKVDNAEKIKKIILNDGYLN